MPVEKLHLVGTTWTPYYGKSKTTIIVPPPDPDPTPQPTFTLRSTKPNGTNTGAGVVRTYPTTVINGNVALTAGQSLMDTIVHGKITCTGSGIVIENCVVDGGTAMTAPTHVITTNNSTASTSGRAQIRFTTVYCANPSIWSTGIGPRNYYAYRVNVYNTVDCFSANNAASGQAVYVQIEGSYGHNMSAYQTGVTYQSTGDTHDDVIQLQGGDGAVLIGNCFEASYSTTAGNGPQIGRTSDVWTNAGNSMACIMINTNVGPNTNMVVEDNWLDGGNMIVNGGGGGAATVGGVSYPGGSGSFKRNKFGRHADGSPLYTLTFDATYTATCYEGTADKNIYESVGDSRDGLEVTIRRNF